MIWMVCALTLMVAIGLPAVALIQRKLRQSKTAAALEIKSTDGIVEESFVRIGGMDQWIGIRGEHQDNPVLLILHGGPGCSYSIFTPHLRPWEKYFTLVQWDQRGGGRTFSRMDPRGSAEISFEQLTRDAIEVAEYVQARLRKDRIFLLASSLGSTFGTEVVRRRPDLFYAYIGTDQNVGMQRGRDKEHGKVHERLRALGLKQGVKALERIGPDPTRWSPEDYNVIARWTMKSDPQGFRPTMKLLKDAVWYTPGWTLKDVRAFVAGMRRTLEKLLPEIARYDAWKQGAHFEIPVFIFQGENDVLTTLEQAEAFFADVVAPIKRMALIPDAGHFAAFMQPDHFLRELLVDVRPLAETPSPSTIGRTCQD
ncbi:alpha/beta fold hydrolase [Acidicapsa acidisoli]|uniref:alpha/beta fold hydrolase n=1 Tax=Acidicapsa acidisoli TaxID=1615681 RepID=UPI0021E09117|nr:alpha/beta hydrolase [Acidicapsa acidisoli]